MGASYPQRIHEGRVLVNIEKLVGKFQNTERMSNPIYQPPLGKMPLEIGLCSIILTYKKGISYVFRESEECGQERLSRASPLDPLYSLHPSHLPISSPKLCSLNLSLFGLHSQRNFLESALKNYHCLIYLFNHPVI